MGEEGGLLLVQLKTTYTVPPVVAPKGSGGGSQHHVGAPKEVQFTLCVYKMLIIGLHKSAIPVELGRIKMTSPISPFFRFFVS